MRPGTAVSDSARAARVPEDAAASLKTLVGVGDGEEHVRRSDQGLANALSHLNPLIRRVLALRFGLDGETVQTLEEVGVGWESRASACAPTRVPRLTRVAHSSTDLEQYLRAE